MEIMLSSRRHHYMAIVSIFLIAVVLVTEMMGCTSTQCNLALPRSIGTRMTTMAESSENVTTYDGDLVIDGYEEFVIEECTWIQKGDIVIKDYGKLTVNNAVIRIEMDYWQQSDIHIHDQGSLHVVNGQIMTNQPNFSLYGSEYARLEITSSELVNGVICGGANFQLDITDSYILGLRINDQSKAALLNSHLSELEPMFLDSHSAGKIDGLVPGLIVNWNLHENEMVTNVGFDLTLTNVTVDNWMLTLNYESGITVSESAIGWITLDLKEVPAHIKDLKPGFHEDLKVGSLVFRTTSISSWMTNIRDNTVITIEDSMIGLGLNEDTECAVSNSEIWPWTNFGHFVGKISFNETEIMDSIGIWESRFSITGGVKFRNAEIWAWVSSDVTRNYEVVVKDRYEDTIPGANLTLRLKDGTQIWNGTTDSQGRANFDLIFTDSNYTDTLRVEAVKGDLFDTQDITFLSNTPVILTALAQYKLAISKTAGGSVTNPGEGDFTYEEGTWFYLVAEAEEGYQFVNWTGDVDTINDVNAASTTITMNDNYSITANFEAVGGCFIATAAYGMPMAEEIQILREFRDEYLLTNPIGQAFVDFYYKVSPPIAEFITEHPGLKPIVRAGLVPAVAMSAVAVNTTPAEKVAMVGLLVLVSVAVTILATRQRRRGTI